MASKRGRKKERQKQRKATLTAPQLPSQPPTLPASLASSHTPEQPHRPSLWRWLKFPKWAWVVSSVLATVLATVITLFEGYPWLSVSEGSSLDTADPFSELFKVTNDGFAPVMSLDADCWMNTKFKNTTTHIEIGNNTFGFPNFAGKLYHSRSASLPCFKVFDENIGHLPSPLAEAEMSVSVSYSFWPLKRRSWRRKQTFNFTGVKARNGEWHWLFDN